MAAGDIIPRPASRASAKDSGAGFSSQIIVPESQLPARSSPISGIANATSNSASFAPDLGRAIWVRLAGNWSGSVQLKRSTDGGNTWYAITSASGSVKGIWTGNINAPITEETCVGATYRLEIALISGSINYEVRQ